MRLVRGDVVMTIVHLVRTHCANLRVLRLADNALVTLEHIANLVFIAPDVQLLDLSENMVRGGIVV